MYQNVNNFRFSLVGIIQTVLSWKIFQPLSRLTFCIYLVHLPLMTSRALMTRVPIHFSGVNSVSFFHQDSHCHVPL